VWHNTNLYLRQDHEFWSWMQGERQDGRCCGQLALRDEGKGCIIWAAIGPQLHQHAWLTQFVSTTWLCAVIDKDRYIQTTLFDLAGFTAN